jgi:DNA-directed RNA polymerase subunit N (RpoN/RPB10)
MIIPIKCFTCGKVIADKYNYFLKKVREMKEKQGLDTKKVIYLSTTNATKTPEGVVMDELQLTKICCRRHMLSHVNIE